MPRKSGAPPQPTYRELTADDRAQMKQWLENWKRVGPILEQERWTRVWALTDETAWREAYGLLQWWLPEWQGDGGEGLLLQQDVFRRSSGPGNRPR